MSVSKNSSSAAGLYGGMPYFEYHGIEPGAYYPAMQYRQVKDRGFIAHILVKKELSLPLLVLCGIL